MTYDWSGRRIAKAAGSVGYKTEKSPRFQRCVEAAGARTGARGRSGSSVVLIRRAACSTLLSEPLSEDVAGRAEEALAALAFQLAAVGFGIVRGHQICFEAQQ